MSLDPNAARPLTSREIAKAISGLLGGLSSFCHPRAIADALDHFNEHRETYMRSWHAGFGAEPDAVSEEHGQG